MSLELLIKSRTLAAEARIIRQNEVRLKRLSRKLNSSRASDKRELLYRHRIDVVRPEARATHLARAFIKGRPYHTVEKPKRPLPERIADKVASMVSRYDPNHQWTYDEVRGDVEKWLDNSAVDAAE